MQVYHIKDNEKVPKVQKKLVNGSWKDIPDGFLPPGLYIEDNSRLTDIQKRMLDYYWVPSRPFGKRFIAADTWTIRHYFKDWSLKSKLTKEPIMRTIPDNFFSWQKDFCQKGLDVLKSGYQFKTGLEAEPGSGKTLPSLFFCSLYETSVYVAPEQAFPGVREMSQEWGFNMPLVTTPGKLKKLSFVPDVVIIDEALIGKNPLRQRSQAIAKITQTAQVVIAMTGTPSSGQQVSDLRWLNLIGLGGVLPPTETAIKCLLGKNPVLVQHEVGEQKWTDVEFEGWDYELLDYYIKPYCYVAKTDDIARTVENIDYKKIVLPCPRQFGLIQRGVSTQKSSSKIIAQLRSSSNGFITKDDGTPVWLETPSRKVEKLLEIIADGKPTIIVSAWIEEQQKLMEILADRRPAQLLATTTNLEQEIARFQTGETDLAIMSFGKSSSMNLQRASRLIFLSNGTKPADRLQAIRRIYRIGQQEKPEIIDIVCKDTYDEKVIAALESHLEVTDELLKGV